jgi:glyoxylase-like metal-dependent hydrolase (beta-lactamase superfamily II)
MPPLTRVMILYCGQGMTTMVEVYDDGVVKDQADYLALIDCGGSSGAAEHAVNYVAGKILYAHGMTLDLLVISHQDGDHHSFLNQLKNSFATAWRCRGLRQLGPLRRWPVRVAGGWGLWP